MMTRKQFAQTAAGLAIAALTLTSQTTPREQVGPLPNGGFLLNSGWRVQPVGQQVALDTFPMSSVLSRDGRFLIVLNGGYNPPSLSVLETSSGKELGRVPVPDAWLGLALSPDGKLLWVGGGSKASIYEFSLSSEGKLAETRTFELAPAATRTHEDFTGDVAVSPDGRLLYAADLFHDAVLVVNPESGRVIERFKTGRRPYRIMVHPDGKSFFVTSWADGTLNHHQADNGNRLTAVRIGAHPTDMVWRNRVARQGQAAPEEADAANWKARIFVAAANTNSVYAIGVGESDDLKVLETINVAMTPRHPLGMTPSALALSPDQSKLYVACSDANAVAVADVKDARAQVLGFIPVGWYPTAVRALSDGRLVVLNGRGARSYPNPAGPNPTVRPTPPHVGLPAIQYVGHIQTGSASFIPAPTPEQLDNYSKQALANSPYRDELLDVVPTNLPPIEHVIYIVKENRSYDQVLGDIGRGQSDPSLELFPENVTPNLHKLAREFVLLDNFYVNGDVSADGHNWSTAAIASDYVQKMWPNSYGKRRTHYDYEGGEPAAGPPAGYIWTNALQAGVSMRNYGYFATNKKTAGEDGVQISGVRDPALQPVTNPQYRGFDLEYPDAKRADTFLRDLAQFEASSNMPRFLIMRLGNDHTYGTSPGKLSPLSMAADNDYALGRIAEGVSKSKFWNTTAIFVLEDDAQNGSDHIDSHRSPAFVISAYSHAGAIDSTMYNTTSVLRTMELMLHLRPMTHFDAGARPMANVFQKQPNLAPYTAEKPRISL
ncbi:MAG: beta-propeller fold lactonase family protein, partial [Acidobacteriota bacterium]|nr:beta-propeller fold lactonase family protein [Acidobacteriota bacterium]